MAFLKADLSALFGLQMTGEQLELFRKHTDRQTPPTTEFSESHLICGRRRQERHPGCHSGLSGLLSRLSPVLSTRRAWHDRLMAADLAQAKMLMRIGRSIA